MVHFFIVHMTEIYHSEVYAIDFTKTKITLESSRCHCVYVCVLSVSQAKVYIEE